MNIWIYFWKMGDKLNLMMSFWCKFSIKVDLRTAISAVLKSKEVEGLVMKCCLILGWKMIVRNWL